MNDVYPVEQREAYCPDVPHPSNGQALKSMIKTTFLLCKAVRPEPVTLGQESPRPHDNTKGAPRAVRWLTPPDPALERVDAKLLLAEQFPQRIHLFLFFK